VLGDKQPSSSRRRFPDVDEVDMTAIGPFPRYFAPPPYAQKKA
jgi:hypothetical protein